MAIFTPGPAVAEIRGSIGGSTFSRNTYGAYIRSRAKPTNPNTSLQVQIRTFMRNVVSAWRLLSDDQREAWNTYATSTPMQNRLGQTIYLSGFNHYCRSNVARLLAGLNRVDDAPSSAGLPDLPSGTAVQLSALVAAIQVSFDDSADWASEDGAATVSYTHLTLPTICSV